MGHYRADMYETEEDWRNRYRGCRPYEQLSPWLYKSPPEVKDLKKWIKKVDRLKDLKKWIKKVDRLKEMG